MTTKPALQIPPAGQCPALTVLPDPPKPPDMQEQFPYVSRAYLVLEDHFLLRPDVFVGSEGYLCYEASDVRHSPRPDCMVAIGIAVPPADIAAANGYTISEIGRPPDFVLEVASKSTGRRDYIQKREDYAGYGVAEYWRFDHTGGRYHDTGLAGDRLVNGRYEPIQVDTGEDGIIRGYSPALALELHWHHSRLRFWNPVTGEYLPDLTEAKAQRDGAERQAEVERAARQASERRAEVERAARQAAEEQVRQLEAELNRRRQSKT